MGVCNQSNEAQYCHCKAKKYRGLTRQEDVYHKCMNRRSSGLLSPLGFEFAIFGFAVLCLVGLGIIGTINKRNKTAVQKPAAKQAKLPVQSSRDDFCYTI